MNRMVAQKASDQELLQSISTIGIAATAKRLEISEREIYRRRRLIEGKIGENIVSPVGPGGKVKQTQAVNHRIPLTVGDGVVIVAGDAHYWPGEPPFMHRALVHMIRRFRDRKELRAVIANGDMMDLAAISRWPQINWEKRPSVIAELEVCQERMHELAEEAARVPKIWSAGNHDLRFNNYIAERAPELAAVKGVHLKDHFPLWEPCWSVLINESVFIKHRLKGGMYAVRNNVLATGLHTVTNHLHSAVCFPVTNMMGTLWGVDSGCIADVTGPQFLYTEDNPKNWREAFVVLTFDNGELLPPELVLRHEGRAGHIVFRGEVIKI